MTTWPRRSSLNWFTRGATPRLPGYRRLAGLVALLVVSVSSPVWAAVQYGTSASGTANSATTITLSSFSATAGENRLLLVGLAFGQGAPTGVSVTYGGVAFTLASGTSGTKTNAHVEIWYLINPGTGPSNIVASWTGSHDVVIGAAQFANVDQATPISNGTVSTATSTSPSVTVTSATGKMTFNTVATLGTLSAPTQTQLWLSNTPTTIGGGGSYAPGAATVAHAWTSTSASWAAAAVGINATATSDFKVGSFAKSTTAVANVTYQSGAVLANASATSITLSGFDPGSGSNRALAVGLMTAGAPANVSVKYGGVSLTLVPGATGNNGTAHVEMWYLANPSSTPANIVATWTGSRKVVIIAGAVNNVDQTTPIANGTTSSGTSSTASVAISSNTGDLTLDMSATLAASVSTSSPINLSDSSLSGLTGGGSAQNGASTVTHQWSLSSSAAWVCAGLNFRRAAATQVVAHGLGQTPKALIFWTSGNANTSVTSDFNFSLGFTDGTASGSVGAASQNGRSAANAGRRMADKVITIVAPSQETLAEADLVSWDGTNFTLNWSTNNATAYIVHFIAISGTDVSASVVDWTMKTSTGNKAVTGIGFKPTVVMHLHSGVQMQATPPASLGNSTLGFGVMDYSGHQWATEFLTTDSSSPSEAGRAQQTDSALYAFPNSPTILKEAKWVSMDADGFTMNFTTADSNAGRVYSLALSGLNVWVGNFNKTTGASNSTQAITGTGFLPQALMLASFQDVVRSGSVAHVRVGIGASDGITQGSSAINDQDGQSTTVVKSVDSTTNVFTKANNNTLSTDAAAVVNSLDADGFTLKWTTNDAVATQMMYLAMGPLINTEVRLISFDATRYSRGTLLQWKTGYEINNLGFDVYRELNGVRTKVNVSRIAGSGLQVGAGHAVTGELMYAVWDVDQAATGNNVVYWLDDVDMNGQHTLHGPYQPAAGSVNAPVPTVTASRDLTALGAGAGGATFLTHDGAPVTAARGPATDSDPTRTQWTLTARAAIKIGIRRPGWYRITQPELVAAGLDPRLDARTLHLVVDGEEQALRITGAASGRLATDGAIEFYATGLDTAYSDTRIYWLTAGGEAGQRVSVVGAAVAPGTAVPSSFWSTVGRKDRSIYFAALTNGDKENWFGSLVTSASTEVILPADHFDPGASAAELAVTLQGVTIASGSLPNHRVGVVVNGVDVGELLFSARDNVTQRFAVPQGLLRDDDNVVTLTARGGDADYSLIDEVRLSYWHLYRADADVLRVTLDHAGPVRIGGFARGSIRVMDITNPAAPSELVGDVQSEAGGFASITVRASGDGARTLLAFSDLTLDTPAFVQARRPTQWHDASRAHDYVVIANARFVTAAQSLVTLRQQQGYHGVVIDVQDLYDEFSFGHKTPYAIRDFLLWARLHWQLAPRFVVLFGDATIDPRDYAGLGDADLVPTKQVEMAALALETASDDWFVDVNGDGLPDVPIGRLSARTVDQANAMVAKIVDYDRGTAQPWTKDVLLVTDRDEDGSSFDLFASRLQSLVPPAYTPQRISRGAMSGDAAHAALTDRVNDGQLIVNYTGHGSVRVWGRDGDLLTNDDVAASWRNATRLPLVIAMNCLTGFFNQIYDEESLAEALQRAPGVGAVAVWASSSTTPSATQALVNEELFRLIFQGTYLTVGEAVAAAKRVVGNSDLRRSWIFFGDPAMQLTGAPRPSGSTTPSPYVPPTSTVGGGASDGASATPTPVLVANSRSALRLADWNGDGRADVFVATGSAWRVTLSQPEGARIVSGVWDTAWEAYPANLNGDAAADLVLFDRATGMWAQALNDGALNFQYTYGTWGPEWTVQIADLNGDGLDDVLLTNPITGAWFSGLNDWYGSFVYRSGQWPVGASAVLGDFLGDGRLAAWVYARATGVWQLAANDGAGGFSPVVSGHWAAGWTMQAAHLTPHAWADLLLYNPDTGAWAETITDVPGVGSLRGGTWTAGLAVRALDAPRRSYDLDEVLLYQPQTGQASILTRRGGVTTQGNAMWLPDRLVATGDLDADGRTDLVLFDPITGRWVTIVRAPLPVTGEPVPPSAPATAGVAAVESSRGSGPVTPPARSVPPIVSAAPPSSPSAPPASAPVVVPAAAAPSIGGVFMPARSPAASPSGAVYDPQAEAHTVITSLLPGAFAPAPDANPGTSQPGASTPSPAPADAAAPVPGPTRLDSSAASSDGPRAPARDNVRAPAGAPEPEAPMPEPAEKSPGETDEDVLSQEQEPSPAERRDRLTFLITLHHGDNETVAGGVMTAGSGQVTIVVRHAAPAPPGRIDVRFRRGADSEAARSVLVAVNGVRVGEIAFDADAELPSLVVPPGLLTEGANTVTLSQPAGAISGLRSVKPAIDASR